MPTKIIMSFAMKNGGSTFVHWLRHRLNSEFKYHEIDEVYLDCVMSRKESDLERNLYSDPDGKFGNFDDFEFTDRRRTVLPICIKFSNFNDNLQKIKRFIAEENGLNIRAWNNIPVPGTSNDVFAEIGLSLLNEIKGFDTNILKKPETQMPPTEIKDLENLDTNILKTKIQNLFFYLHRNKDEYGVLGVSYMAKVLPDLRPHMLFGPGFKDVITKSIGATRADWNARFETGISEASCAIIVNTSDYFDSPYCLQEWQQFQSENEARKRRGSAPLKLLVLNFDRRSLYAFEQISRSIEDINSLELERMDAVHRFNEVEESRLDSVSLASERGWSFDVDYGGFVINDFHLKQVFDKLSSFKGVSPHNP
jgi:hypothetical protein